jgi:hypothetical protein
MALSDIFTVPFLVSLGITLLLVGFLGMFFVQRLQEQNHKMASMLGLVSTMAEELNFIRGRLQMMSYVPQTGGVPIQQQQQSADVDNLIPVSDGDEDSDSEDDIDEDDEDEDEDEDSEESSVLEFDASINNIIELTPNDNAQTVKIINFGDLVAASNPENETENLEDLDEVQDLDDMEDLDEESENDTENDAENNEEEDNVINLAEVQEELVEKVTQENLSFIKSINISNLEENSESGSVDYKKMSMTKLKSIALAKGLIQENSKATKNAILKMLSSE